MLRIWIDLLSTCALPVCRNIDGVEREKASRKDFPHVPHHQQRRLVRSPFHRYGVLGLRPRVCVPAVRRASRRHTGRIVSSPVASSVPAVPPFALSDWRGVRRGLTTLTDKQADKGRGLCIPFPSFSLRPFPRAVLFCRYYEHQFDIMVTVAIVFVLCIPCDGVVLRLSCVVYFSTVEKAESSSGASRGGCSIYRRRFILLAAHSYPLLLPASPFPLFSFPICVPVRLACRLASRLVVRLVSCVPLRRAVYRAVLPVRHVVSFRAVSFCCSLVLVLFVVA